MDRLPQEIVDQIVSYFVDDEPSVELWPYATVSRRWRFAIEARVFRKGMQLMLDSSKLAYFRIVFRDPRWRQVLGTINYVINLPKYEDRASHTRFETNEDRLGNDAAFTRAIMGLFGILRWWDRDACSIRLVIYNVKSQDDTARQREDYGVIYADKSHTSYATLAEHRFQYSYINLLRPESLPVVPCITHFRVQEPRARRLAHVVPFKIAAVLPNLAYAEFSVNDDEQLYPILRLRNRRALVEAVSKMPPMPALRRLRLSMSASIPTNPSHIPPRLQDLTQEPADQLSTALFDFTTRKCPNLAHLLIKGTIDWSLFWPDMTQESCPPFWQNLEALNVEFHPATPSGQYYFQNRIGDSITQDPDFTPCITREPPGYSSSLDREERITAIAFQYLNGENFYKGRTERDCHNIPVDETLNPLMIAYGRACSQIPHLRITNLRTRIAMHPYATDRCWIYKWHWGVWYAAPKLQLDGQDAKYLLKGPGKAMYRHQRRWGSHRQLLTHFRKWQPSVDAWKVLRNIGREAHGDALFETHSFKEYSKRSGRVRNSDRRDLDNDRDSDGSRDSMLTFVSQRPARSRFASSSDPDCSSPSSGSEPDEIAEKSAIICLSEKSPRSYLGMLLDSDSDTCDDVRRELKRRKRSRYFRS